MAVSIPNGFSSSLQLMHDGSLRDGMEMFQSLMGFQARCNKNARVIMGHVRQTFQSLMGFQARCNISIYALCYVHLFVSIPNGFSSSLQRYIFLHILTP